MVDYIIFPPIRHLNLIGDVMFYNESGNISSFISILESDDQSEIASLLSQVGGMSRQNITSMMFAASFPQVSNDVFKRVVDSVTRWGDQFRGAERERFDKLRSDPEAFEEEIYMVASGNRILDLMDAHLTLAEVNKLTRGRTPLHLAVLYKKLNGEPDFPEYAVIRYLTSCYLLNSMKPDSFNNESAIDCARGMSDPFLIRLLTDSTHCDPLDHLLFFHNKGQAIVSTNYWTSKEAKCGLCFLTWKANAARLLVPDPVKPVIREMRKARYVIVSRGLWHEQGEREAFELLFEDGSDNQLCLHILAEQTDKLMPDDKSSGFWVTVWTRGGEKLRLPGKYRNVASIPCLSPWGAH